jgi:malate dehydrogenase (oxaloacetate-decarboxylating)
MGIPIGKLALYTACAGIHPQETLPILLDVGTDNQERLRDPMYVGWHNQRVRGAAYDEFVDRFVQAVTERWPHVLLQWEDFAGRNAGRLLDRYRDRLCTFNDDIQGTAAVAAGALMAAINVTGTPLTRQRIVMLGMGSAGCGIASLLLSAMEQAGLSADQARRSFYGVDIQGLLLEGMPDLHPAQVRFAQARAAVANWKLGESGPIGLLDVIVNAKPTTLIGVSGQPGVFTEGIVRAMAVVAERPVIFPLSNPTSRSEARPADLLNWTGGRAIVGSGSPFPGVDQTNNSYIFPGVGLGVLSVQAERVTDAMFMAAAGALADMSPARLDKNARLLPPVSELRSVSVAVARAVAKQAQKDGVADEHDEKRVEALIRANVWEPAYQPMTLR